MEKMSINDFIEDWESVEYYGFYDWFCYNSQLKQRAKSLVSKLKFLVENKIVNGNNTYVLFKNNCPTFGSLYDDMRFSLMNEEDIYLGVITPSMGYDDLKNTCSVYRMNFKEVFPYKESREIIFKNWIAFKKSMTHDKEMLEAVQKAFYHE